MKVKEKAVKLKKQNRNKRGQLFFIKLGEMVDDVDIPTLDVVSILEYHKTRLIAEVLKKY